MPVEWNLSERLWKQIVLKFNRAIKAAQAKNTESIPGVPSSLEEVKQNITAFEADLDADILETVSHQDVMKDVRQMLASL